MWLLPLRVTRGGHIDDFRGHVFGSSIGGKWVRCPCVLRRVVFSTTFVGMQCGGGSEEIVYHGFVAPRGSFVVLRALRGLGVQQLFALVQSPQRHCEFGGCVVAPPCSCTWWMTPWPSTRFCCCSRCELVRRSALRLAAVDDKHQRRKG